MRQSFGANNDAITTLATLVTLAESALLPGEKSPFHLTAGQDRRARVQAIRDRTGWVYPRCREVAAMTDSEIEALVREHEEAQLAGGEKR